jgi:hypothetical protein
MSAFWIVFVFVGPGIFADCPPTQPPVVEIRRGVRVISALRTEEGEKPVGFPSGRSLDTPRGACLIPRPFEEEPL